MMTESSKKEVRVTDDEKVNVYKETQVKTGDTEEIHVMTTQEEDLTAKARKAGDALSDLVTSAIDRAKAGAKEKTRELVKAADHGPGLMAAQSDSRDITRLGPLVEDLARVFEDTMTDIRRHGYGEQQRLLLGYRKLLEEQINVVNSRVDFAKRLKQ